MTQKIKLIFIVVLMVGAATAVDLTKLRDQILGIWRFDDDAKFVKDEYGREYIPATYNGLKAFKNGILK